MVITGRPVVMVLLLTNKEASTAPYSVVKHTGSTIKGLFRDKFYFTSLCASAYGKNFVGGAEHNLPE